MNLTFLDCLWELAVAYARFAQGGVLFDVRSIYSYYVAVVFGDKETV